LFAVTERCFKGSRQAGPAPLIFTDEHRAVTAQPDVKPSEAPEVSKTEVAEVHGVSFRPILV
jgi:hypothetical protein